MGAGVWPRTMNGYVVDIESTPPRLGQVTADVGGCLYLRPPGGGTEWIAEPKNLRPPTEAEWDRIRVLTTPVVGVTQ